MQAPVTYQGGKQRLAPAIVNEMRVPHGTTFHDICCGCGAVSIELVSRGHRPEDICMVDVGPWGQVWQRVGSGTFSMARLRHYCEQVPTNKEHVKGFMEELAKQDALHDTPYVFLLLQAAAFGGKAIWFSTHAGRGKWENTSFRSYWKPTPTSNRRSPVNPMMPMPETLIARMETLCTRMRGVHGYCVDASLYVPASGVAYVDPPYKATTRYGASLDTLAYVKRLHVPTWVSEGALLSERGVLLSTGRTKGGISGVRASPNAEWLSAFNLTGEEAVA